MAPKTLEELAQQFARFAPEMAKWQRAAEQFAKSMPDVSKWNVPNTEPQPPGTPPVSNDETQAQRAYDLLRWRVRVFQARVAEGYETVLNVLGTDLSVHTIGYLPPSTLTFEGVNSAGEDAQVLQHVSLLNVQLIAKKRLADEPRRPIGFAAWEEEKAKAQSASNPGT